MALSLPNGGYEEIHESAAHSRFGSLVGPVVGLHIIPLAMRVLRTGPNDATARPSC